MFSTTGQWQGRTKGITEQSIGKGQQLGYRVKAGAGKKTEEGTSVLEVQSPEV